MRTIDRRAYRMGMPDVAKHWTRAEVLALPDDGQRYELVDGELLVSPAPRYLHQRAVAEFYRRLHDYVARHGLGEALFSPSDLDLRAEQLVQPDLFVVAPAAGRAAEWADVGIPRLVVEVLSPSTARYDRVTKRRRYQRSGIPTYWVVDLDARLVEVWNPDAISPTIADVSLEWRPEPAVAGLVIDLAACFETIWNP